MDVTGEANVLGRFERGDLDPGDRARLELAEVEWRLDRDAELSPPVKRAVDDAFLAGARYGRHLERRVADKERGSQ